MIHMAEKERIINTTTSRWLWTEMIRRRWRQNEPGYVWRDRAIGFELMLESGIHTKRLTWADAERITGVRHDELQKRIEEAAQTVPSNEGDNNLMENPTLRIAFRPELNGATGEDGQEVK